MATTPSKIPTEKIRHVHVLVSKKLAIVNASSAVVARLINVFGFVWVLSYLLHRISVEEFSIYPLVNAIMLFSPFFFSFFVGGVTRLTIADYAKNKKLSVETTVSSIFPILFLFSFIFFIGAIFLAENLEHIFSVPPEHQESAAAMLILLASSFTFQMILLPFGMGHHIRQRFIELNAFTITRDLLKITLMYLFFTIFGATIFWVVVATVIAEVLYAVVVTWRSRRLVPALRMRYHAFQWARAREILSFGVWTTLGRLASILYISAGTFVLNLSGTAADVTSYYLAASCFQHIQALITVARQPLQPALIAMHTLRDEARLKDASLRGGKYGLWVALLVALPLAVFSSDFVRLVSSDGLPHAPLVLILFMALFLVNQPTGMLPSVALARGEVRRFNLRACLSSAICVAAVVWLVRGLDLGAAGAAFAITLGTLATQLLFVLPLYLELSRSTLADVWRHVIAPGLTPAVAGGAAWLATAAVVLPLGTWLALGTAAAGGGVVYAATLLLLCLDPRDRDVVAAVMSPLGAIRRKTNERQG